MKYKIDYTDDWTGEIEELEAFFEKNRTLSEVRLNKHTIATNVSRMVTTHLAIVKENNGNPTFLPYLNRLKELKNVLSQ